MTAPAPAAAPALETIKVATWNLEWLNRANDTGNVKRSDADYGRLRKYAQRLGADIVAVQEVDGEEALLRVFDDATYDFHVASQNGVQLTGFAYRSGLSVTRNPDHAELDVGGVRVGTDLTVTVNEQPVRLLSVHLKSGCTRCCRRTGRSFVSGPKRREACQSSSPTKSKPTCAAGGRSTACSFADANAAVTRKSSRCRASEGRARAAPAGP